MISYVIVIALALIGGVATVMVGLSQENKKSSPKYEGRTKTNMVRLVLLYVLALAAFVTIWVIYN
ncbi:hypothetical protein SAMN05661091_1925 [Paenibacillus uliginis N3/975]|uniref:Uncharacterized protein n=1 Tax=Paenibacillus uliginis N3/975 TaxID=1313296 RepID=A0A1X7H7J9_9BACL|nr:hypothetical protein [Paenibacillus uliginis]SMF81056.1 hypothetical protein SAMN05661091_1925 [Paenibacillus uliginis N3/975]